jgi:hypothetical protein
MMCVADEASRTERLRDLDGRLRGRIRELRALEFDIGRLLLDIRRLGDCTAIGSTTFPMYCESVGLSPVEGRELTAMVEAAEVRPEVETRVVEARLSPQKASLVHEIQKDPRLQRPGEDLLGLLQGKAAREAVDELKRRRDEARIEAPPVTRTFHFSARENDEVDRTREVLSGMERRMVTDSEAVARACREFNDRNDRERIALRMKERDGKASAALLEAGVVGAGEARPRPANGRRPPRAASGRSTIRVAGDRRLWKRRDGVWVLIARNGFPCGELPAEAGRALDRLEPGVGAGSRAPP